MMIIIIISRIWHALVVCMNLASICIQNPIEAEGQTNLCRVHWQRATGFVCRYDCTRNTGVTSSSARAATKKRLRGGTTAVISLSFIIAHKEQQGNDKWNWGQVLNRGGVYFSLFCFLSVVFILLFLFIPLFEIFKLFLLSNFSWIF